MATQRVDLGPTGEAVAANVARMRSQSGLTLRQLAARISDAGRPISHTTLSQIEAYSRRVTVDELVAIAAALEVSPAILLMPRAESPGATVTATGLAPTTAMELWEWITAEVPLVPGSPEATSTESMIRSRPFWTFRQLNKEEVRELQAEHERRTRDRGND